jgi:hypothetical protein
LTGDLLEFKTTCGVGYPFLKFSKEKESWMFSGINTNKTKIDYEQFESLLKKDYRSRRLLDF